MRLKITNGDFIIIHVAGASNNFVLDFERKVRWWLTQRNLTDVEIISTYTSHESPEDIRITVLSVNDVFEDELLKKE